MNKLKKYFVPHKGNDYTPHFWRTKAVFAMASVIGLLFLVATSLGTVVIKNGSEMLGAVISSVLVDLANSDRTANKLQGLTVSPVLEKVAQMKAEDMAAKSYFAHISPEGRTPWYWFREAGYKYSFAGENLAVYFSDSVELEKAWMNSPTHRANILNSYFTEIGIGMVRGTYQGRETVFVVQSFGRPSNRVVSAALPPKETVVSVEEKSIPTAVPKVALDEKPIVKGVSQETPVKVLAEEDTFIAIENKEEPLTTEYTEISKTATTASSLYENEKKDILSPVVKIITSPKTFLETTYGAIALFILLALLVLVGVEFKRHHLRHIIYGLLLLALMGVFLYIWQSYFFGQLLVL